MSHLITDAQRAQLLANGAAFDSDEAYDPFPVVKLFTPDAGATWLLTHIDPDDPGLAFGLCDLGVGCPEPGSVSLSGIIRAGTAFRRLGDPDEPAQAKMPMQPGSANAAEHADLPARGAARKGRAGRLRRPCPPHRRAGARDHVGEQ
jgi:hypothetical protein